MSETTVKLATEAPKARGFGYLPCPRCGETGSVAISLAELTHAEACQCGECEAFFGLGDIEALVAAWAPVLKWVQTAPVPGGLT